MKIQVLGSGCPTCKKLHEITEKAVKEMSLETTVEYLTGDEGISKIVSLGIMKSPVLVMNEKPVMVGFNSDVEKVKAIIRKNI